MSLSPVPGSTVANPLSRSTSLTPLRWSRWIKVSGVSNSGWEECAEPTGRRVREWVRASLTKSTMSSTSEGRVLEEGVNSTLPDQLRNVSAISALLSDVFGA